MMNKRELPEIMTFHIQVKSEVAAFLSFVFVVQRKEIISLNVKY
jgi:hypothetical protein